MSAAGRRVNVLVGLAVLASVGVLPQPAVAAEERPSRSFAGYVSWPVDRTSIQAQMELPTLDCGADDVGIVSTVELASAHRDGYVHASVASSCSGGAARYRAYIESSSQGVVELGPVGAGALIQVRMGSSDGLTTVKIYDRSGSGLSERMKVRGVVPVKASATMHTMSVGGVELPVAPFAEGVNIKHVIVGGEHLLYTDHEKLEMVDEAGDLLIRTAEIAKRDSYKLTYVG